MSDREMPSVPASDAPPGGGAPDDDKRPHVVIVGCGDVDYGNLATVGREAAVVDLTVPAVGAVSFRGLAAWRFWLFAHIHFLIGFRNRLTVMLDWARAYLTYERSARVVAEPASKQAAS